MNEHYKLKLLEEELRSMSNHDAPERAKRYLEIEPHNIVPGSHFAEIFVECARLHRDGHFYGSIALCQAVGEAIIRYIGKRNKAPQG